MRTNKTYQLNEDKKPRFAKVRKVIKAAAWFVVAGSQLFSAYLLLLNFNHVAIISNGIFIGLLGLGIVARNFYKSSEQ